MGASELALPNGSVGTSQAQGGGVGGGGLCSPCCVHGSAIWVYTTAPETLNPKSYGRFKRAGKSSDQYAYNPQPSASNPCGF